MQLGGHDNGALGKSMHESQCAGACSDDHHSIAAPCILMCFCEKPPCTGFLLPALVHALVACPHDAAQRDTPAGKALPALLLSCAKLAEGDALTQRQLIGAGLLPKLVDIVRAGECAQSYHVR